jgi:hypothetical protein
LPAERAFLDAYLRKQVVLDRDLKRILRKTIKSLSEEIDRLSRLSGAGNAMRATQLSLSRDILSGWAEMGDAIETNIKASADDLAKVQKSFDKVLFDSTGAKITEVYTQSLIRTAEAGLDSYISRQHHGMNLSERVYRNGRRGIRTVDAIINESLLAGRSAREIALRVRRYISPSVPGGMSYAALRLGRTELNNAFHATSIRMADEDPFTKALKWNLSRSHPEADICDSYAGREFAPSETPDKPHPQCFCFTTPVPISNAEFLRRLRRGEFNDMAQLVA